MLTTLNESLEIVGQHKQIWLLIL